MSEVNPPGLKIVGQGLHADAGALDVLRAAPLFTDLTPTELHYLAQRAERHRFAAGESIFAAGDECPGLWIVAAGQVRVYKSSPSGREQVLTMEGPGSTVAELPVFDGGNYPASASAACESVLWFVHKHHFHALCQEHPAVALKVLRVVGRRLRGLVAIIEELSFTTVRSRLVAMLLRLSRNAGRDAEGRIVFTLLVNNQEIASHIGTVRELVSRNMSRLQAEGLISLEGRQVTLLDPDALAGLLESGE